ncbi:hypothetical protein KKC88_00175 [Patescibacteria group bacterium]|nr:hypothetical protein [Patescibacteria group bacterium]MBU1673047.1 hypothetical protein [Patescibacteria group bacterium]
MNILIKERKPTDIYDKFIKSTNNLCSEYKKILNNKDKDYLIDLGQEIIGRNCAFNEKERNDFIKNFVNELNLSYDQILALDSLYYQEIVRLIDSQVNSFNNISIIKFLEECIDICLPILYQALDVNITPSELRVHTICYYCGKKITKTYDDHFCRSDEKGGCYRRRKRDSKKEASAYKASGIHQGKCICCGHTMIWDDFRKGKTKCKTCEKRLKKREERKK